MSWPQGTQEHLEEMKQKIPSGRAKGNESYHLVRDGCNLTQELNALKIRMGQTEINLIK